MAISPSSTTLCSGPHHQNGIQAIAEAVFASEAAAAEERVRWLCSEVDDVLSHMGVSSRALVRASVLGSGRGADLRPPATALERLSVQARIEALAAMEKSFAAAPLLAVKALLCIVYYEHPTWRAR